jgi:hypothetical protein
MGRFHVFIEFDNKNWSENIAIWNVMLRISIYIPHVKSAICDRLCHIKIYEKEKNLFLSL